MKWIVKNIICPQWVAFSYGDDPDGYPSELGLQIFGVIVALYKGDIIIPDSPKNVRPPRKFEFLQK